jgi:hypothetical protein
VLVVCFAKYALLPVVHLIHIKIIFHVNPCSDPKDVPIVVHTQDWMKASLMNHWLKGVWPPSSPDYNPLDYFMWSKVEREANKHPHNTQACVLSQGQDLNIEREIVILPCQRF